MHATWPAVRSLLLALLASCADSHPPPFEGAVECEGEQIPAAFTGTFTVVEVGGACEPLEGFQIEVDGCLGAWRSYGSPYSGDDGRTELRGEALATTFLGGDAFFLRLSEHTWRDREVLTVVHLADGGEYWAVREPDVTPVQVPTFVGCATQEETSDHMDVGAPPLAESTTFFAPNAWATRAESPLGLVIHEGGIFYLSDRRYAAEFPMPRS